MRTIAYVYCVGSRQSEGNQYCSRYCCTAAVHAAIQAHEIDPALNQYHLYRDMRTYGKNELLFEEAGRKGSVFVRYDDSEPPEVEQDGDGLLVRVRDELVGRRHASRSRRTSWCWSPGWSPRSNERLRERAQAADRARAGSSTRSIPSCGRWRRSSTASSSPAPRRRPKNLAESVASSMAAVANCSAMLLKGHLDRAPLVAKVDPDTCVWCEECVKVCPYEGTIVQVERDGKQVAEVHARAVQGLRPLRRGLPVGGDRPRRIHQRPGHRDDRCSRGGGGVMSSAAPRPLAEILRDEMIMRDRIAAVLHDGPKTIPEIAELLGAPSREVTLWVMAMRRYGRLEEMPKPKIDDYFRYKLMEGHEDGVRALTRGCVARSPASAAWTSAPA